jgi:hypothetical protein
MKMLDVLASLTRDQVVQRHYTKDGNSWEVGRVKCTAQVNALLRRGFVTEGCTGASRNRLFLTTAGRDWYALNCPKD